MSRRRKDIMEIKQLLHLKLKGFSNRAIGELAGMNRKTVNDYINYLKGSGVPFQELLLYEEARLQALLPDPKEVLRGDAYQVLLSELSEYRKALASPGFTFQELFLEYRKRHADGYGISQFKVHLKELLVEPETSLHVPMTMGDKLLADYCGKKLSIVSRHDGSVTEVEGFVAVLGGSGLTYFEVSLSQQKASFFGSLSNALSFFGGTPKLIITDNLKSAVTKPDRYEPILNKDFAAFGLHYGTALLPTRAHKPKDKALVERTVQLVYEQVYFKLRGQVFFDIASLNAAIAPLVAAYNDRLYQVWGVSRRELFISQEQGLLTPLPEERFILLTYKKATVSKNYHVLLGVVYDSRKLYHGFS